jgi:hypothetical protein
MQGRACFICAWISGKLPHGEVLEIQGIGVDHWQ